MSMPVATYQCTACDFSGWDCVTWGYCYYRHGDVELPMQVALGWCNDCRQLTAMESSSSLAALRHLGRTSPERCLMCGSTACTALPARTGKVFSEPVPIGFLHPGCRGELTVRRDGLRLNLRLEPRGYDLEGYPLR